MITPPLAANAMPTLGNAQAMPTLGNPQQPQMQQPADSSAMLQAQLLQQQRNRDLADSLMKQGYVPNSGALGSLAMIAQAWKGKRMNKEADEKIADYSKRLLEAKTIEDQEAARRALEAEMAKEQRKATIDREAKEFEFGLKERETPNDAKEAKFFAANPELAAMDMARGRSRASNTNITMPGQSYPKPFEEALAKADVGMYDTMRQEAMAARSAQASANELRTVLDKMPAGKPQEFYGQMATYLGAPAGANYQAQKALVEEQVNAILQQAKGPQTDRDADRARAQIPNMGTDPQARKVIFDYIERKNKDKIETFKRTDAQFRAGGNLWQNETNTEIPEAPQTKPQGVPSDWTLHTDARGNKAYVSPDGKQFKEVN